MVDCFHIQGRGSAAGGNAMRARPIQVVMVAIATLTLFVFATPAHATATVPDPPTGVNATAEDSAALVGWTAAANGGSAITGYTISPSPACGGCTGLTTTGSKSSLVSGLTNGTPYTFTVVATNVVGDSASSAPSSPVTPTSTSPCTFDSFPAIPGSSSELAVACQLSTLQGAAGNQYRVEDYPQAVWHTGAGRVITTTAATPATNTAAGKVITASGGHFTAQDINETITGPGIKSNTFIVAFTATSATLNKIVGAPGVVSGAVLNIDNSTGRTITDTTFPTTTTIGSATGHFCRATPALGNCGTKTDVGVTVSGTRIQHGTTITAVGAANSITLSLPTIACPAGDTAVNCNQVGIGSPPGVTTFRQIKDATFVSPNKVCSATARFATSDLNLTIASVGAPNKFPAGDYITAVNAAGCPVGTTEATIKVAYVVSGTNKNLIIGARNSSAPLSGDAVMSLASELAVSPSLAAGVPACSSNAASGSNLQGKWLNPGSFDVTALGQPGAASVNGPMIAQLEVTTGAGNPAFAGYVIPQLAATAGESDTAVHFDIVFPSLLTGIAVCPYPSTVGVATTFRFTGETLSQSTAGNGDVREFADIPAGGPPVTGSAWEHIFSGTSPVLTTSGDCTDAYPTTSAGYTCGGS
jgi:hypothetical protein